MAAACVNLHVIFDFFKGFLSFLFLLFYLISLRANEPRSRFYLISRLTKFTTQRHRETATHRFIVSLCCLLIVVVVSVVVGVGVDTRYIDTSSAVLGNYFMS